MTPKDPNDDDDVHRIIRSPIAAGAILLGIYIAMYLAVAGSSMFDVAGGRGRRIGRFVAPARQPPDPHPAPSVNIAAVANSPLFASPPGLTGIHA